MSKFVIHIAEIPPPTQDGVNPLDEETLKEWFHEQFVQFLQEVFSSGKALEYFNGSPPEWRFELMLRADSIEIDPLEEMVWGK